MDQGFKRVTRFASKLPPSEILSKIEAAATPLGFDVEKHKYKVRSSSIRCSLYVQIESNYYYMIPVILSKPSNIMFQLNYVNHV